MLYFEDFEIDSAVPYGSTHVSEDAILAFARQYDAQPMHLDATSDQARMMGGLIASGWQSCCLNMRMMAEGFLLNTAAIGAPGITSLKWMYPVRPGDTLSGTRHVIEKRISKSRPDRGFIVFRFDIANQHGQIVLEQTNPIMLLRRDPTPPAADAPGSKSAKNENYPTIATEDNPTLGCVQDLIPGSLICLGSHHFEAHDIVIFARNFDPQPFHLSDEEGKKTHFGGLVASGWQTAAIWMRLTVDYWRRERARRSDAPKLGPSPGFRDLQWLRPVRPGDTLTYYSQIEEARLSASRPGWGLVTQRSYALNQAGEPVFSFIGTVLWEAHREG